MGGMISRFSILFHWSICLFLCQYHTVLITVCFKIRKFESSYLILLFQDCFIYWESLEMPYEFQGGFFYFWKKKMSVGFDWNCIKLVDHLGNYCHLKDIKSSNPWTWGYLFIYFFNYFQQHSVVSGYPLFLFFISVVFSCVQVFYLPWLIPRDFILFAIKHNFFKNFFFRLLIVKT